MKPRYCLREIVLNANTLLQLQTINSIPNCNISSRCILSSQIKQSNQLSNPASDPSSRRNMNESHREMMKRLRHVILENELINGEKDIEKKQIKMIVSHLLAENKDAQENIIMKNRRPIISCLMYKTYVRLLRKDLNENRPISSYQHQGPDNSNHRTKNIDVSDTTLCDEVSWDKSDSTVGDGLRRQWSSDDVQSSIFLKQKMYDKYHQPSDERVKKLKNLFPEPVKLFYEVMQPVHDAGLYCHEPVKVSSHLNGFYWKAKIQLLWPRRVAVVGKHTNKENVVQRVYFAACEQLMQLGLLVNHGGSVCPVNCDTIVNILEEISEFGDMTNQDSRGKGFKIVLEKINKQKQVSAFKDNLMSYTHVNGKVSCEWRMHEDKASDDVECRPRSRWSCTVHVGWPIPLSVRTVALSLPSAQMTALLTVASNFKTFGLIHKTNKGLDTSVLQHTVMMDISRQWYRCMDYTCTPQHLAGRHRNVDATIHVDASNVGYGAYLQLDGSDKVSWLCESWADQPTVLSKIYLSWDKKLRLRSSLAELYALASTIFSWKRKLQHHTLVCYSDNQVAISLLSTVNKFTKPSTSNKTTSAATSHLDECMSAYGCLVDIIQDTCDTYNIDLQASWLQRDSNWLADSLANWDIQTFKTAFPNAATSKTKVKQLPWKDSLSSHFINGNFEIMPSKR